MEEREIVIPGDRVATEEECVPEKNTIAYDGTLYATVIGRPTFEEGKASVEPQHGICKYGKGMLVSGTVVADLKSVLFVDIDEAVIGGKRYVAIKDGKIIIPKPRDGRDFGRHEAEAPRPCASSDVVLARIFAEDDDSYMLGLRDEETGVVFSRCERCNGEMEATDGSARCIVCDYRTRKKISPLYGKFGDVVKAIERSMENIDSYNEEERERENRRRQGRERERGGNRYNRGGARYGNKSIEE
jgi:exosome complex RNA-binding protein Csl4